MGMDALKKIEILPNIESNIYHTVCHKEAPINENKILRYLDN